MKEKSNPGTKASLTRLSVTVPYLLLCTTFIICIIIANLTEIKTVDLGWFTITAGVIVFPISYVINDCVVEVYGFARAKLMIWLGFIMSLAVALFLQIAIWLPGAPEWHLQDAMESLYGAVPRIMAASFIAFLAGSMINAWVMSLMKSRRDVQTPGTHGFRLRAIVSTIFGEGVDSLIFFPIAFAGYLSFEVIVSLIVTQTLLKTVYEILILPVTVRAVRRIARLEGDNINPND
ncbi:MAG: queuosine precursor transporter [Bacteroidales bacterium]|nr:queuosine precursor transporter [Bacteroidales bacterium]